MTDNRTTELLCKLLDERGEDYTRNDFGITWSYYSDPHTATESMDGTLIVTGLTPDQAIAATLGEQIIRCRDCKHATISTTGVCKYCEMFVLPDVDGYGADPQVNLPLDFFCGFAERKEVD